MDKKLYMIRVNAALYRIEAEMVLIKDDPEILARAYRLLETENAELKQQVETLQGFKRSVDAALNSGNGAYRP